MVLRQVLGLQVRQLCLQGADRRLDVLCGHELSRRPGAPRCARRRRLGAGRLRHQPRGGGGVRLRGRRLHLLQTRLLRRVRGGKERFEGRDSAGVEAKQRNHTGCRGVLVAWGRSSAMSSREVLERRDAQRVGDSVVVRRSLEHASGVRGVAGATGRVIAHHERDGGGPRLDLGLGPLLARRAGPRATRPDFTHRLGADAELWRDDLAVHHRAAPERSRSLELRVHLEDFERARGGELPRVVPRLAL